jgi:hypothetical protein
VLRIDQLVGLGVSGLGVGFLRSVLHDAPARLLGDPG